VYTNGILNFSSIAPDAGAKEIAIKVGQLMHFAAFVALGTGASRGGEFKRILLNEQEQRLGAVAHGVLTGFGQIPVDFDRH
jgi:hypothetical protein